MDVLSPTPHVFRLHTFAVEQKNGAHDGTRIRDLFLTKEVLYQLSYMGLHVGRGRSM